MQYSFAASKIVQIVFDTLSSGITDLQSVMAGLMVAWIGGSMGVWMDACMDELMVVSMGGWID